MNTVISVRPLLRASACEAVTRFLQDHLDLPPGIAARAGEGSLDVGEQGEVCVELLVVDLGRAIGRCEAGGATLLGAPRETPAGREADLLLPGQAAVRLLQQPAAASGRSFPLGAGPVHFTVGRTIATPAADLFRALTGADSLARTHLHRASGDLDVVGPVEWWWTERASSRLEVAEVEPGEAVAFTWRAHHLDHRTSVRLAVRELGDRKSRAAITEWGWSADERGRASAFAHAEGWTELLVATEALLLHGVSLKPRRGR